MHLKKKKICIWAWPLWLSWLECSQSHTSKDDGFNSSSGHIPTLLIRSQIRAHGGGRQWIFLSHIAISLSFFISLWKKKSWHLIQTVNLQWHYWSSELLAVVCGTSVLVENKHWFTFIITRKEPICIRNNINYTG